MATSFESERRRALRTNLTAAVVAVRKATFAKRLLVRRNRDLFTIETDGSLYRINPETAVGSRCQAVRLRNQKLWSFLTISLPSTGRRA